MATVSWERLAAGAWKWEVQRDCSKKGQTVTDEVHVPLPSMIYGIPYIYLTFDAISDMRVIRLGSGMKYS